MKDNILITVLMSVYNTEPFFLREAIDSILNQTYENFEFIIIDDCSNSSTREILEYYDDTRIKIIRNDYNLGLTKSLNKGLKEAKGKYIARMDADDVSLRNRLFEQVEYMEKNPDITVLGTHTQNFSNKKVNTEHWSSNTDLVKIRLLFCNAGMAHPTAFFRKEHLDNFNIKYDESIKKTQDYAMWVNISQYGKMDILPRVLLKYRVHNNQISIDKRSDQLYYEKLIKERQLQEFGIELCKLEKESLFHFYSGDFNTSPSYLNETLTKLTDLNHSLRLYNPELFEKEVNRMWVLASIKRIAKLRKVDMLFNVRSLRILKPNNFIHLLKYIFFESSKTRVKLYSLFNK